MMTLTTSKLLAAALAISSMTAVNGKADPLKGPLKDKNQTTTAANEEYTPVDINALANDDVEMTTTTTSSRAAEWGTMAATTTTTTTTIITLAPTDAPTTLSPTDTPTDAPTTPAPSTSPTKRLVQKSDILPLCQPALQLATTYDADNSSALNKHEFSQFIESTTGDSAATVILTSASDVLYSELREACVSVFKMPTSCYDETTTSDDDDVEAVTVDNGKFDKLEDSEFVYDGVLLVGFEKTWDVKEKEEKKYEEFFCKKLVEFYVVNDVLLDWTLVDGPPAVVDAEEDEVVLVEEGNSTVIDVEEDDTLTNSTAVVNNTDVVDWSAIANLTSADNETTTGADNETTTVTTTTAATTTTIAEVVTTESTTTTSPLPEEEDETNTTNTASGINAADTSFVQSINQQPSSPSSEDALDKIPLGGWIGIGLGAVLLVFLVAALIVSRKRRSSNTGRNARNNNDDDNGSIWSDDEETNMMRGAGGSPMSSVAAIGMASTVATRLSTGDTEVTLMKKQLWTEKEPVV